MRTLFFLVELGGLAFFLVGKRRFDLFTVAFLASTVYFLPGLLGYVLYPRTLTDSVRRPVPLIEDAYGVMILVLLGLLAGALVYDRTGAERWCGGWRLANARAVPVLALILALVGLAMTIRNAGPVLWGVDKEALLTKLDRWRTLSVNAAMVGAVTSLLARRWLLAGSCFAVLGFELFIGFRLPMALATIAAFTAWLAASGRQRCVVERWRVSLAGLAMVMFFFVYKPIYQAVKLGDWRRVVTMLSDPGVYLGAVIESEPFNTQAILHRTLSQEWQEGGAALSGLLVSLIPFVSAESLGAPSYQFSGNLLFPEARGGLASNFWAEMWSIGRWPMVCFAIVFVVFLLAVFSTLLGSREPVLRATVALLGSLWAFYLHRNTLVFQITLSRRLVALSLICSLCALAWHAMATARGRARGP